MTGTDAYEARDLSRIAERHAELRGPARPRFVGDLLCVPLGPDRIFVVGGEAQTLQGGGVSWLMTTLVPLLDGTRTVADLAAQFPLVAPADLKDAIHLLHLHGMLEDAGEAPLPPAAGAPETAIYFSRYLRRTGRHVSGRAAQRALEAARVCVAGDDRLTGPLASMLRDLCVADVTVLADTQPPASNEADPVTDLVVAFGTSDALADISRRCRSARVPLLAVDPDAWTIGPLTIPGASACPTCVRLQLPARERSPDALNPVLRTMWERALVCRVAQHIAAFATGLFQVLPIEHIEEWRPLERDTRFHQFVAKLPNCPLCGADAPPRTMTLPSGHAESRARVFHSTTIVQPWHLTQPAGMLQHITPHVRQLLNEAAGAASSGRPPARASQGGRATLFRPAAAVLSPAPSPARVAGSRLDARSLGTLLFYSFGGRVERPNNSRGEDPRNGDARVDRHLHTASAGNLASAEAYVICRCVDDVAPGLHQYVPAADELRQITSADGASLADALARAMHAPLTTLAPGSPEAPSSVTPAAALASADAIIFIVSAVARLCGKYYARGYTYALLDAGVMAHRVHLLARELGFVATPFWRFEDEAVAEALGVDGIDRCPQVAIAITRQTGGASS